MQPNPIGNVAAALREDIDGTCPLAAHAGVLPFSRFIFELRCDLGNGGNDWIDGGTGADSMSGGAGNDYLDGGAGTDTFLFSTALGAGNVDIISGFVSGEDKLLLTNGNGDPFGALSDGPLDAVAFDIVGDTTAASNVTRIIYDPATGALYYDADGSGGNDAVQFATLINWPAPIAASDIIFGV